MNKIVKEHYPANKLPADLRDQFAEDARVTVEIIEEAHGRPNPLTAQELVARIKRQCADQKEPFRSQEDIVGEIRELRDEWDD